MTAQAPLQHQSTKAAKRREADRIRKREVRARMKAERIPHSTLVDYALVQAMSFCTVNADKREWAPSKGWAPVNSASIMQIAVDILNVRFGKDRLKSIEAVKAKLGPQAGHRVTGMVPSTDPAPDHPRYDLRAPRDLSAVKSATAPLPPQDLSAGR